MVASTSPDYDLIVIGSGPGGYVAAIRAAQRGLKVALIERDQLGGICLNWGCIPTKALLRAGEIYHLLHRLDDFGLKADKPRYDTAKMIARSRAVAKKLSQGVRFLMKKNRIAVIEGTARFDTPTRLEITDKKGNVQSVTAKTMIIATGARALDIPGVAAGGRIWTYKEAMTPQSMPKSVLIAGSGAIGVEFASFYNSFGVNVTIVEMADQILPHEDAEIAAMAADHFRAAGIKIHTGKRIVTAQQDASAVDVNLEAVASGEKSQLKADYLISAVGITGNIDSIGLDRIGVKTERGHIVTTAFGQTGIAGVYAIGDVAGPPWLAHKASHEGVIAVAHSLGDAGLQPLDQDNIPACTYCAPQIASIGMTEAAAQAAGRSLRVGRFPFHGNGKALALGESEGLVKTIFDAETGALLGAHMIGAEVTELIQGFVIARTLESTEEELMHTIFAHPTLSEMMHESVLAAYDRALHV